MNIATTVLFSLVASLIATSTLTHTPDPANDGWVRHVEGRSLEICYRNAKPPAVGETVQILRTSYILSNTGPSQAKYTPTGTAQIKGVLNERGCESAELIDGNAKRTDHARHDASLVD